MAGMMSKSMISSQRPYSRTVREEWTGRLFDEGKAHICFGSFGKFRHRQQVMPKPRLIVRHSGNDPKLKPGQVIIVPKVNKA